MPQINDIAFVGAVHPEHGPGFDVWVGGGLSTNPMLAQRLGVWVPLDEVPEVWKGVTSIFRDYGYRRLRTRARLKFLIADWGVEKFREVLETEYLDRKLIDLDAPEAPETPVDHVGVFRQKDGNFYRGRRPHRRPRLRHAAQPGRRHRRGARRDRVRTTPMQKLLVLDVDEDKVESLVAALDEIGLRARPSQWRRNTMACTGIEYCKLAIVETKDRAAQLVDELEERVPELDTPITVNVNGCPNSCARIQTADIGLKGMLVLDEDGNQVEGFQVHLGGALGLEAGFGRKLRAHKVTDRAPHRLRREARPPLPRRQREDGESFARWVARADEEVLR